MRTNLLTLFFFSYYSRFTFFQCLYLFIMQCVCVFIFLPAFYICITFKKIFYPAFLPLYQCFYFYQLVTFLTLRFYFFARFLNFVSAFLPFYLLFCLTSCGFTFHYQHFFQYAVFIVGKILRSIIAHVTSFKNRQNVILKT